MRTDTHPYLSFDGGISSVDFSGIATFPLSRYPRALVDVTGQYIYFVEYAFSELTVNLHKSEDGGATWSVVSGLPVQPLSITCSGDGQHLFGTSATSPSAGDALYISSDYGDTWTLAESIPSTEVSYFGSSSYDGSVCFAVLTVSLSSDPIVSESRIYYTFDGFSTTNYFVNTGYTSGFVSSDGTVAYFCGADGLVVSTGNFVDFTPVTPVSEYDDVEAVWCNSNGSVVVARTRTQVFLSTDAGSTWELVGSFGSYGVSGTAVFASEDASIIYSVSNSSTSLGDLLKGVPLPPPPSDKIFLDGFDYYSSERIQLKWVESFGMEILPTSGRRGSGGLTPGVFDPEFSESCYIKSPIIVDTTGVTLGLAIRRLTEDPFTIRLTANGDGLVELVRYDVQFDGSISVVTNETTENLVTASIPLGEWVYIEIIAHINVGSSTVDGSFTVYPDTPSGSPYGDAYAIATGYTVQPDSFALHGATGNWIIDDLYFKAGTEGFGNARVDAIEADYTESDGWGTWTPSDGVSTLEACVNASDSEESRYAINPGGGNGPNSLYFGYSTPIPETIHATQINAWMSMDPDVVVYNPALQIGIDSDFEYYTPPSSEMTGISAGKIGVYPDVFGYDGNE
jgi:hypothetical protein